ncbi:hypothetical protein P7K49_006878 [Saguinus oedipus]|uniref:Uncharacterized protein n=1 Tax=Saguinus oedipus TaxID=9490 RepID=A0ABQ9W3N6_SAGOE|nr:hypothetical protein P7K49_006878 [Saguinus oedipus]
MLLIAQDNLHRFSGRSHRTVLPCVANPKEELKEEHILCWSRDGPVSMRTGLNTHIRIPVCTLHTLALNQCP